MRINFAIIHPVLFAIFPSLFLYSQNIGKVALSEVILPFIFSLALMLSLFFIFKVLLRDLSKVVFMTSVALLFIFSFGHIYTVLQGIEMRYRYLLIAWGIIFLDCFLFVLKTQYSLVTASRVLNAASGILVSFSLMSAIYNQSKIQHVTISSDRGEKFTVNHSLRQRPDIYYIILDRYGSLDTLFLTPDILWTPKAHRLC